MKEFYSVPGSNRMVYVGKVSSVEEFTTKGKRVAVVTLQDWREEEMKFYFNNNPSSAQKKDQKADRVFAAKVHEGSFLTILAAVDEGADYGVGIDFKYRGKFSFSTERGEVNVLLGSAMNCRSVREGMYSCTIPVDIHTADGDTTDWVSITFFNNDRHANADIAAKILRDKDTVAVLGGTITEKVSNNGNVYHNMVGWTLAKAR